MLPLYVHPDFRPSSPENWTQVVIVGVEEYGATSGSPVLEDRLRYRNHVWDGLKSEGMARASVERLANYWIELALADELRSERRLHKRLGAVWLALSDVARIVETQAGPHSGVLIRASGPVVDLVQSRDPRLPSSVIGSNYSYLTATCDAESDSLRALFHQVRQTHNREGDALVLHWAGHGVQDGLSYRGRHRLIAGGTDGGHRPYLDVSDFQNALQSYFKARTIFTTIDACRVSTRANKEPDLVPMDLPFGERQERGRLHAPQALFAPVGGARADVTILACPRERESHGLPFEPSFFTDALVNALDYYAANDPLAGDLRINNTQHLATAISVQMQMRYMTRDHGAQRLPSDLWERLYALRWNEIASSEFIEVSGMFGPEFLSVAEPRSLLVLYHEEMGKNATKPPQEMIAQVVDAEANELGVTELLDVRWVAAREVGDARFNRWASQSRRAAPVEARLRIGAYAGPNYIERGLQLVRLIALRLR